MRKFTSFLAVAGIAASAFGQNVVVVMNDGTSHKFNADYIQEIRFTDDQQAGEENIVFNSMTYNYYGYGNFWGEFVSGGKTLDLDMYGPEDAPFLLPGTYTVGASEGNYIDTGDWSSYTADGVTTLLSAGTVTISDNNGVYTFDIDLLLANGQALKAKYEGLIGGAFSSLLKYNIQNANYNGNPNPAGEFYINMSAYNPNIEMALDIFADADATVLPAGKYVYSKDNTPGTFNNKSYVDLWGPYSSNRMKEGSEVNVTVDGNVYTFDMTLLLEDGRTAYINYTGEIAGTPTFE